MQAVIIVAHAATVPRGGDYPQARLNRQLWNMAVGMAIIAHAGQQQADVRGRARARPGWSACRRLAPRHAPARSPGRHRARESHSARWQLVHPGIASSPVPAHACAQARILRQQRGMDVDHPALRNARTAVGAQHAQVAGAHHQIGRDCVDRVASARRRRPRATRSRPGPGRRVARCRRSRASSIAPAAVTLRSRKTRRRLRTRTAVLPLVHRATPAGCCRARRRELQRASSCAPPAREPAGKVH